MCSGDCESALVEPAVEVVDTTGFANASPSSSPSSKRNFNLLFLSAVITEEEEEDGVTAGMEGALDTGLDAKRSSVSLSSSSNMDFFLPAEEDEDEDEDKVAEVIGIFAAQDS